MAELNDIVKNLSQETKADLLELLKADAGDTRKQEKEALKAELHQKLTETDNKPYLIVKRIKLKKAIADLQV